MSANVLPIELKKTEGLVLHIVKEKVSLSIFQVCLRGRFGLYLTG